MAKWQRAAAAVLAAISMAAAVYAAARRETRCRPVRGKHAGKPAGTPIQLALIEGMSGPFANAGAAVERNLRFGVEQVNAHGGVKLADGAHPLELVVLDSKGSAEEALVATARGRRPAYRLHHARQQLGGRRRADRRDRQAEHAASRTTASCSSTIPPTIPR